MLMPEASLPIDLCSKAIEFDSSNEHVVDVDIHAVSPPRKLYLHARIF